MAVTGSDAVSSSGENGIAEPAAGGQVSSTQAWMERYTRRIKPDERKWRTKSMRRGMGGLPASTRLADEVVSKVLLLARWRCKARKHADDRGFSMAARRPWLASLQQISERSGCVFGAGLEHDGIKPHVEMILKVSHAEQARRLDLAAEERDKELTSMDVIHQRVNRAMEGVKRWSMTGRRTLVSKDENISLRSSRICGLEGSVVGDGGGNGDGDGNASAVAAAAAADVQRPSLLLQGPPTAVAAAVVVDGAPPTGSLEVRPSPPSDALSDQRHAKSGSGSGSGADPAVLADNVESAPPLASAAEAATTAAANLAVQPSVEFVQDSSPPITTVPSSPPIRRTTPVAEPHPLSTRQDPGDAAALSPPSPSLSPSPSPSLPLQPSSTLPPLLPTPTPPPAAPSHQPDKLWPDCNDLNRAGLASYLAAAAAGPSSSPPVTHGSEPAATGGVIVTDLQPSPSAADSQGEQPAAGQPPGPQPPEAGEGQQVPAAVAKGGGTALLFPGPNTVRRLALQNPVGAVGPGATAPPRMHGAGGSLHDTAPSLGGLDICRVAAAPIGGPVAAVAAVAAAAAADSMTLSRQVRAVPLLHSLTMSKRGRKAAVPAPAPVPANTTLRQPTAQETATSAAAAESKATGGKLAAKLPSKTAAVAIGGGASSRGGLWARVAPGEGVGRHNSVEVRSLSFNSQTSLPPRNAASSEPEATSRPLASLTRVDAALFWNSEASSPQTCSFAAAAAATTTTTTTSHSSSYSPFSRAGTLSRLHSLLPQPLPLPPSTSSDLVILPAKQMKTGGGGVPREPGGEMGNGAGGVTGEGSGDDEYDGDALISRTSPVRTRGLLQLSPAAVASPLLAAVASPSDRSLTSWSGAAPPLPRGPTSFPSSPALLPNPEAPPSSPLTRNPVAAAVAPQAATGPQLAPLRLQPAMGTATATSTDVPAPSSPTLGSPTTTYSRSGINVNELVGRAAAAATGGSGPFNSQAQAARLNGLASMARVLLSVPGSPSAARRECVLQHQISSISDVNGGFGAVNSPVVAPSACRSLRLEAEDPPLSVLHAARRSVPTSRTSLSLGALPFAAAAAAAAATQYPQNPQQPPNGSPARQRLPYSSIRAMAATDLAEEYGTSRFIIDPIAGLPDAASLGRQGSGLQLRSSASGAQTRVILPELRTTIMVAAAAAAQAAPSATADAVASPLRKGEEQLPTAAAAGAATTAPAGSAEGRLLPCIPPAPAAPFFVRCVDTSSSRNSSGSSSSSRVA